MSSVPEAIGVAGVNSALELAGGASAVRSFAPALAAGCTAVVKLPGQTGLVNGLLHEILSEVADLPAGVLNSLTESATRWLASWSARRTIDVLSYTGSTRVGRQIMAGRRCDAEAAVPRTRRQDPDDRLRRRRSRRRRPRLTKAVTTFSGQFCMTGSRVIAQAGSQANCASGFPSR